MAHKLAQKYRAKYPGLKFIVKKQLYEICGKYSLVTEPVFEYLGDVPEQKLFEMEYWLDEIEDSDIQDDSFTYILKVYDKDADLKRKRDEEEYIEKVKILEERGFIFYHPFYPRSYSTCYEHSSEGKKPLSESDLIKVKAGRFCSRRFFLSEYFAVSEIHRKFALRKQNNLTNVKLWHK
jgi:hypothetical protein